MSLVNFCSEINVTLFFRIIDEPLCYILETNIKLNINSTSIKKNLTLFLNMSNPEKTYGFGTIQSFLKLYSLMCKAYGLSQKRKI